MAQPSTLLDSLKEDEELGVSPFRLTSPTSTGSSTSPFSNILNPGGYKQLELQDGDDITSPQLDNSPSSSVNSLGIFPDQKFRVSSLRRKPVERKSPDIGSPSEAASPDSSSRLLESPGLSIRGSPKTATWPLIQNIIERITPKRSNTENALLRDNAAPLSGSGSPNTPLQVTNNASSSTLEPDVESANDDYDDELFTKGFNEPPTNCQSKQGLQNGKAYAMLALAVYSTIMSSVWLSVSIKQPTIPFISSKAIFSPSIAGIVVSFLAKTIEISFVAVFVCCLGQALTRRSISLKSRGMTLSEITMRDWINSPGSLVMHFKEIRHALFSRLGILTAIATGGALLYTTASNTMVAPKLKMGTWEDKPLSGPYFTSYGSIKYAMKNCPILFGGKDPIAADREACISVAFCGQSYRDLLDFMATWSKVYENGTSKLTDMKDRPRPTSLLYGNMTMTASWIETQHSNVTASFEKYGRIINNVTMAMPHPGVYAAAKSAKNNILQPDDLGGTGEYAIRAGVVSPAVNVMCVNVAPAEIAPLIYSTWPNSNTKKSGFGEQLIPVDGGKWIKDVPHWNATDESRHLNRTVLDDIFKWGPKYGRLPPILPAFPTDLNVVSNTTVYNSTGIYILAKTDKLANYTLCEARSWVSPLCSTRFNISGIGGASLESYCADGDRNAYYQSFPKDQAWQEPLKDWKWVADQWHLSMDMNSGLHNSNASNSRILSQLVLTEPALLTYYPSIAEALATYLASTLVLSSIDSPFHQGWEYTTPENTLAEGTFQRFDASYITKLYTAGHTRPQERAFYVILGILPIINLCCFGFMLFNLNIVTDFTDTKNLFVLAMNSPPSSQFKGSCGGGPNQRDLEIPWRVAFTKKASHYFFAEARDKPRKGKYSKASMESILEKDGPEGSYKRLSGIKTRL